MEKENWTLPHWVDLEIKTNEEDFNKIMDINQWCADHFGELGSLWGYERKTVVLPHPPGLNPVKIRLFFTVLQFSWRFKNKQDAMMFKLTWANL
jgi:hypothetical protein